MKKRKGLTLDQLRISILEKKVARINKWIDFWETVDTPWKKPKKRTKKKK